MSEGGPVVLILGSGPNVMQAMAWDKSAVDRVVVMNNAWRVRPDWDDLVYPEDFPAERMPPKVSDHQRLVDAAQFVPAQNRYGGFVFAGATMAYTTAYWALDALRPRVMAFLGCDMVYPASGNTHFYGTGTADPLRSDVSLRDLGAKSARLGLFAAAQGCACVNLSQDLSSLLFPRATVEELCELVTPTDHDAVSFANLQVQENALGYETPDGRYAALEETADLTAMDALDRAWRALYTRHLRLRS